MQAVDIVAIQFGVRAVLLDDENVDAQLQHGVELDGGEVFHPPHIDLVSGSAGQ